MVVAFIENLEGKYLIQKRSELKGGEWAFTGGHPKHGESSLGGIKIEIKEEIDELLNEGKFKKGHYMMFKDYLDYKKEGCSER